MGARRAVIWVSFGLSLLSIIVLGWLWRAQTPGANVLRLTPVDFSALPGWNESDARAALSAFHKSCAEIIKRPAASPLGGLYAGTAGDWRGACAAASGDAREFFENNFTPFALSAGRDTTGLLTGYYEPEIHGSRTEHDSYRIPVYGLPSDLVSVDLGLFRDALKGERIAGKLQSNKLVPYATRAEIDAKGLANAPVLFYADDPVAVFFLQVQGSGCVVFDDGSRARAVYAGGNGRLYTAIGRVLAARGAIARENLSLQSIRDWLTRHPKDARAIMETNQSYIFFALEPLGDASLGSKGSEGVALIPQASLAIDPRIHAFGTPVFAASHLAIAQDTGGAIRGPLRGDFYWGFGGNAETNAGAMKSPTRFFVLLPKTLAKKISPFKDYALPP
ncbi:MAG TPA: murein transglycosylase A [Rhizomicrobium sp.]